MSFEAVILNRMNTSPANYMDGGFKGAQQAFTSYSEDIGVSAASSQGLWKMSARLKKPAKRS